MSLQGHHTKFLFPPSTKTPWGEAGRPTHIRTPTQGMLQTGVGGCLSSNSSWPCTPACSQLLQTCKSKRVLYVPLKCSIFIVSFHYTDIVLCRSVKVVEKTRQDGTHLEAAASAPWQLRSKAGLARWSSRRPPATKPRRRGR